MALGLLAASSLPAQGPTGGAVVRGTLVTTADQPVALAGVELRVRNDSALIRSTLSSTAGRFQLDSVAEGVYYLLIRGIGVAAARTPDFTVTADQVRDLGMIRLQAAAVQLAPVEVTVERPDVTLEPDRIGYLVEALTSAVGGVVTDALRELPDLVVELDGTIRLRGATPAIYINGRPAPMDGVSLSIFLEQFPADRIERIEVLDVPPARFSAEGAGGIINIVLKEGVELGLTGSLALAAGTRGQYTVSGRATHQRGPLVLNGGLNTRWSDSRNSDFTLRQNLLANPTTFLQQDARSDRSNRNGGASLDVRYDLSPKSRLSGRFSGSLNGSDRDGLTETIHLDALQEPTLRYDRLARQDGNGASGDARIGYEYVWVPERHTLEIQASAQGNDNRNRTREEIGVDPDYLGDPLLPPWLTDRENGSNTSGAGLEIDYRRSWGRQGEGGGGRLEAGTGFRRNASGEDQATQLFEEPASEIPDQAEDRRVSRVQRIGSAYLTLQRRLGKFGVVAGLRGEWVADRVLLPLGEAIDRDEVNLFPSLNLSWTPRPRMGIRVGFSQRISRPSLSVLDPTNRSTDPLNRSVGNPDIESSITRSITVAFNWSGRLGQLSLSPNWNRTTDGWERITTVDSTGVSTSTWDNLTSRTTLGTSLNFGPPRLWGWSGRVNLSATRSALEGSLRPPGIEDGKVRWSVGANLSGPVIPGITAQGSFGYEPGRDLVQGRTSGQWRADFSFRYRLMNNRTSIGLSAQDPFELRKSTQTIRDPSVIQTGQSRVTTRSLTINVSYSFGGSGGGGAGRPHGI